MTIDSEILALQERNVKVAADKAWEVSWTRRGLIAIVTYVFAALFMMVAEIPNPFIGALVPVLGFLISTLTLRVFKRLWLAYVYRV